MPGNLTAPEELKIGSFLRLRWGTAKKITANQYETLIVYQLLHYNYNLLVLFWLMTLLFFI
jgi:hypothetical protein